jgi:hypothetical protein
MLITVDAFCVAGKVRAMGGSEASRWGRSSLLLQREPGPLRLENLHLMFGEFFGGRYCGQLRKGRPHGYGQLGKLNKFCPIQ